MSAVALAVVAVLLGSSAPAHAVTPSATGSIVVSRRGADGDHDLMLRELGTGHEKELVTDEGDDHSPVYSPNGQRIAFVRETGGQADIYVVDAAGATPAVQVTHDVANDRNPAWAADSQHIVFDSDRTSSGARQIFRTNVDDPWTITQLTTGTQFENYEPSLSPDGFDVVHARSEMGVTNPFIQIYKTNISSKAISALTQTTSQNRNPEYSPDGTKIAFSSNRVSGTDEFDIWTMDAAGDNETAVTTSTDGEGSPRWVTHDGRGATPRLMYVSNAGAGHWDMKIINLDGSNDGALLGGPTDDQSADLQPLAGCTIVWDGGDGSPVSDAWGNAQNWDLGRIPTAGDHVCIPSMQQPVNVTHSTGDTNVASVTVWGELTISGGNLAATTVSSPAGGLVRSSGGTMQATTIKADDGGAFTVAGGVVTVNDMIATDDGVFTLLGGTLNTGSIVADDSAPMALTGGTLGGAVTFDEGTFNWTGTTIGASPWTVTGSAALNLTANDAYYNLPSGTGIINESVVNLGNTYQLYGNGSLINTDAGVIRKSAATAAHTTMINVATFDNDGVVSALTGVVQVNNSDGSDHAASNDAGVFNAATGGTIEFPSGRTNLGRAAAFTGAGTFKLNGGTVDVANLGLTIPAGQTLQMTSGTLLGSGNLTGGTFAWNQTFSLAGNSQNFTVAPNTVLDLTSHDGQYAIGSGASLTNNGTINLNTAYQLYGNGALNNPAGKTISKQVGETHAAHATQISVATFDNDGTLSVPSGVVQVNNNDGSDYAASNDAGTFDTGNAGTIEFPSGRTNLGRAAAFTGTGTFKLNGAILDVADHGLTIPAGSTLPMTSGTLLGSGNLTGGTFAWNQDFSLGFNSQNFTVAPNTVLDLTSNNGQYAIGSGASLTNNGTIKLNTAYQLYGYGALVNPADSAIVKDAVDSHATHISVTSFDNDGTLIVPSGIVHVNNSDGSDYAASNDAGTFDTGDAGTIEFPSGRTNLGRAAAFTGTGTFKVNGGTIDVSDHGLTIPAGSTLAMTSGTLLGSGNLTGGTFTWNQDFSLGFNSQNFTVAPDTVLDLTSNNGQYAIGSGSTLTNNGTIKLNSAYQVYGYGALINPAGKTISKQVAGDQTAHTTHITVSSFDNDGTLSAASGVVQINNSDGSDYAANNDAGTFDTGDAGTIEFASGRTNLGRAAALTGTGTFRLNGGTIDVSDHGLTIPAGRTLAMTSGTLLGSGNLTGGTFAWNDSVSLAGHGQNFTVAPNTVLRLSTENGQYAIGSGSTLTNNGTLDLNKAYQFYGSGQLVNAAGTVAKAAAVENQGHTTMVNTAFENNGVVESGAGTIWLPVGTTFQGAPAYTNTQGVNTMLGGTYRALADSTIQFSGPMGITHNSATFDIAGTGRIIDSAEAAVLRTLVENSGTLRLRDAATLTLPLLANTGTVVVGSDSSLVAPGGYTQVGTNSLTRLKDETPDNDTTAVLEAPAVFEGGRLEGNGKIVGTVENNGAVVAPGNSPGTLTVTSGFTQNSGVLEMEVAGNTPGTFDKLDVVSGPAVLKGTLKLVTTDAFTPAWDDAFTMVSASTTPLVAFTQVQGAALESGMEYQPMMVDGVMRLLVMDLIAPTNVIPASGEFAPSTSHQLSTWSTDNTVEIKLDGANDQHSGVDGYSVVWSTDPTATGPKIKSVEAAEGATATSPALVNGSYYAHVRTVDNEGNWSENTVHYGPFFIDRTAPTGGAFSSPTSTLSVSLLATATKKPQVKVAWRSAADPHSGVRGFRLTTRTSTDGKTWSTTTAELAKTVLSKTLPATPGTTYCFSVARMDNVGNTASVSERCAAVPYDNTAFTTAKTSQWSKPTGSGFYRRSAALSKTKGATLTRKNVTAKRIFIVAPKCKGCGTVQVLFNGTAVGSAINLHATKAVASKAISVGSLKSVATGTLTVKVTSTTGKPVAIDAVAVGLK